MLTFNFSNIYLSRGNKILDVGCGEGRHIFGAMDAQSGLNLFGVDMDIPSLEKSNEGLDFFREMDFNLVKFLQGSIYNLPFQDNELDVVICSEVLEHLEDYNKAIQEIHRVLKPGGYFLVSVPSFLPEKICWMLSKEYQNMPGGHVRIFKKSNILKVMQDHNFSFIQSEKYHAFHSAYWWLRCIFWKTQENNFLVKVYKKILERHILKNTPIMDVIEKLLNPILGKSISFYFKKD